MVSLTVRKASPDSLPELASYLAPFASLFRRARSRRNLERYVTRLLTDLRRKNADTIAAAVAGTSAERLQHLVTDADRDRQVLDQQRVRRLVARGPRDGILVLGDTVLPKRGRRSVGVQQRYCGALGKIANCQVVVSAGTPPKAWASLYPNWCTRGCHPSRPATLRALGCFLAHATSMSSPSRLSPSSHSLGRCSSCSSRLISR